MKLGSVLRNRAGATATMVALTLPVLAGFAGMGVDVGLWLTEQRKLRAVADAAAISAALERAYSSNNSSVSSRAQSEAQRNGFNASAGTISVNTPPSSGPNTGDNAAVEVILSKQVPLLFSALFLSTAPTVQARSVANTQIVDDFCFVGLDPSINDAVEFKGSASASLSCGIVSNSNSTSSLSVTGSASVTTTSVSVVGGIFGSSGLNSQTPPRTNANPVLDPYAGLPVPAVPSCQSGFTKIQGTETLNPGTYCGQIKINAGANVTLNPGVYVIDGGGLQVNGGATVSGTGVTIILTSKNGSNHGTLDLRGGANISLTAPTSGTYSGVLFYQDPSAPSSAINRLNGGASLSVTGAFYFPSQELVLTGSMSLANGCVQLLARKLTVSGSATVGSNCQSAGTKKVGRIGVALLE